MIAEAILLFCMAPSATDGDTIRCQESETRIRLFGVNSPEKGQPGYAEATANLARLIAGGLICEPRGSSFNRIVARCENARAEDVGREQLRGGFAVEVCRYSGNAYGTCSASTAGRR